MWKFLPAGLFPVGLTSERQSIILYPYSIKEFWPPLSINFGGEAPKDAQVLRDVYFANVGDVVPVFAGDGKVARYRLNRIGSASGSDHIVSPFQFDLTFVSNEKGQTS